MNYLLIICLSILVYIYALYPITLKILLLLPGRTLRRFRRQFLVSHNKLVDQLISKKAKHEPSITMIVPCYNEENVIIEKLLNFKKLNYCPSKLKLILIDDQSSDSSRDILRAINDPRVNVIFNEERKGKLQSISSVAETIQSDLIVFSDCASMLNPTSIKLMVKHFKDRSVGMVGGLYHVRTQKTDNRSEGEGLYWKYEMSLRNNESFLQTTTHVSGQLYMVRTDLIQQIEFSPNIINDDIYIPLKIISLGYTVETEKHAHAIEYVDVDVSNEIKRRRRISNGNFQTMQLLPELLGGAHYFVIFQLIFHKYLRNLSLIFMVVVFGSNLLLLDSLVFQIIMVLQIAFYSLAVIPLISKKHTLSYKCISIPFYFMSTNIASIIGFYDYITQNKNFTWEKLDTGWKVGSHEYL